MKILHGDPHCSHPSGLVSLPAPKSGKALCDLFHRPQLRPIPLQLLENAILLVPGGFIGKSPKVPLSRGPNHQLPQLAT